MLKNGANLGATSLGSAMIDFKPLPDAVEETRLARCLTTFQGDRKALFRQSKASLRPLVYLDRTLEKWNNTLDEQVLVLVEEFVDGSI